MINNTSILSKGTISKSLEPNCKIEEILGSGGLGITYKVSGNVIHKNISIHNVFAVKKPFYIIDL